MLDDFFEKAAKLWRRGEPFATATVVRAERPTSGKPGDKAIVTRDGRMFGWVGGSCAQPTVVSEALAALADGGSRLVRLTAEGGSADPPEGLTELPMTCFSGGTMEIYIEPHPPRPRLLVAGDRPVAAALTRLAACLGYEVIAVLPEDGDPAELQADRVVTEVGRLGELVHGSTYVVVASHGRFDEAALEAAFEAGPAYVGLVASRRRGREVTAELERRGVPARSLSALRCPAGLDIGARRGDEIALSILAEIVQARRAGERAVRAAGRGARSSEAGVPEAGVPEAGAPEASPEEPPGTARDPVCGMEVRTAGASHTLEHEGSTYYFCCSGCLARFSADPAEFLAAGG